jgi:hypothetical protein
MKKEKELSPNKKLNSSNGLSPYNKGESLVIAPWAVSGCKECGGRGLYISNKVVADYYRIKKGGGGEKDFFRICRTCVEKTHIKDKSNKKGLSPNKGLGPSKRLSPNRGLSPSKRLRPNKGLSPNRVLSPKKGGKNGKAKNES